MSHDVDETEAVRAEALAWFEGNWDPDMSLSEWWKRLAESGWGFPTWPSEWYGRSLAPHLTRAVFDARRAAGALGPPAGIAANLAGPTLIAHGTDDQKQRFLPRIVHGEVWCQLFSEPGSGSDLASLQTRAERDGDEWIVNGQKVWTSGAQIAKYGILVARTDPTVPKHRGLSYFVLDMEQPGVEVRPIREMSGRAIFNEVFFTDARVSNDNLVSEAGNGWAVALTTLANERTMLGAGSFGSSGGRLAIRRTDDDVRVGDLVSQEGGDTDAGSARSSGMAQLARSLMDQRGLRDDKVARQEFAAAYTLLEIARFTDLRVKAAIQAGGRPGPEVSVGKLAASHLLRTLRDTLFRFAGMEGTLWGDDAPLGGAIHEIGFSSYLVSIGGGTDQIQRNIIGERVLGLPAEPRVDKDVPFSELKVGTQR